MISYAWHIAFGISGLFWAALSCVIWLVLGAM